MNFTGCISVYLAPCANIISNHKFTFGLNFFQFYEKCFFNAKAAFVSIPIVSTMIILSIIMCLHWAPFHKKTLKKPGKITLMQIIEQMLVLPYGTQLNLFINVYMIVTKLTTLRSVILKCLWKFVKLIIWIPLYA